MNIKKKSDIVMILLVILIITSIITIIYLKKDINANDELMQCIAKNATLYISKTCEFCAQQKIILGDSITYFKTIDCIDNSTECAKAGIAGWPTWNINEKMYLGLMSIEELKEATGC